MKIYSLFTFFFAVLLANVALGQVQLLGGTYIKHFQQSITYTATPVGATQDNQLVIEAPLPGAAAVTWRYCTGPLCSPINPVGLGVDWASAADPMQGMGIAPGAAANQIVIAGIPVKSTGDLSLTLRATQGASTVQRTFRLISRKPNHIVFALDRSGSMECATSDWGWPCSAAGTSRWEILKDAMDGFMGKLLTGVPATDNALTVKGDQISVAYFDGSAGYETGTTDYSDQPPLSIDSPTSDFADVTTFKTNIADNMMDQENLVPPGLLGRTGTNIAAGLYNAIKIKHNYTGAADPLHRRAVVLMTDGDQNSDYYVRESGANAGKEVYFRSGTPATTTNWDNSGGDHIEVYTIGFGSLPSTHPNLMANIANSDCHITSNGADYSYGAAMGVDVFNKIFRAYSPQAIRTVAYTNPPDKFSETFECNTDVSRLFLEAYTDGVNAARFEYTILKDSVDVTQYARTSIGEYHVLFNFDFNELPALNSKGAWTIICEQEDAHGVAHVQHHVILSATADDHAYKFEAGVGQDRFIVGDNLKVTARFSKTGAPISNAQVAATLLRPGDDWGDVVARAAAPTLPKVEPETGSIAQQKYAYLDRNNPEIVRKIDVQNFNNTIQLVPDGQGGYDGSFGNLDLSGVYQVLFRVSYDAQSEGKVDRSIRQSVVVRFGDLDITLVPQRVEVVPGESGKPSSTVIRYTPAYRSGNRTLLVGPGFENSIEIVGSDSKLKSVTDNGDGSYTLQVSGSSPHPKADIFFYGEKVHTGPLVHFGKSPYRFNLSLHGGVTQPFGKLDSLYKGGGFAEIDFGYRLSSKWSLEAVGGYYGFKKGYSITGGTLYLKWDAPLNSSNGWVGTLAAGAGIFKPESESAQAGLSIRGGVQKMVAARLSLSAEAAFFTLPKADYSFGTLGIGLCYHF